jgi:hypothetical protein
VAGGSGLEVQLAVAYAIRESRYSTPQQSRTRSLFRIPFIACTSYPPYCSKSFIVDPRLCRRPGCLFPACAALASCASESERESLAQSTSTATVSTHPPLHALSACPSHRTLSFPPSSCQAPWTQPSTLLARSGARLSPRTLHRRHSSREPHCESPSHRPPSNELLRRHILAPSKLLTRLATFTSALAPTSSTHRSPPSTIPAQTPRPSSPQARPSLISTSQAHTLPIWSEHPLMHQVFSRLYSLLHRMP